MSNAATRWAYAQTCGSPAAKAVLTCLADFADDDGNAWPSLTTIAERTELSRRSVIRAIKQLEERGMFTASRTSNEGVHDRNTYTLNLSKTGEGVVTECHQGSDTVAPGVVTQWHPNHHIEPPLNHHIPPDPPEEKPVRKRKPVQTELPDGWVLPDDSRAYAREQGMDDGTIERVAENFALHHRSKGNRFKNWHLAWCKWVRNEISWHGGKARPAPSGGQRSSGGAYVGALERLYGSGDGGGPDRGSDDGTVASAYRDIPDPGEPGAREGGVVIELFGGAGGEALRRHDDPPQDQWRRQGQGRSAIEGDCLQAVAVPGSGRGGGAGGMVGHRGVAPGMGEPETASGSRPQDPAGPGLSYGASEW